MRMLKFGFVIVLGFIFILGCKQQYTIFDGEGGGKFVPKPIELSANNPQKTTNENQGAKIESEASTNLNAGTDISNKSLRTPAHSKITGKQRHSLKYSIAKQALKFKFRPNKRCVDSLEVYKPKVRERSGTSTTGVTLLIVGLILFFISFGIVSTATVAFTSTTSAANGCLTLFFGYVGIGCGAILALVGLVMVIVDAANT